MERKSMELAIQEIAQDVLDALGLGHSETLYGRAIGIGLQRRGIHYETEKTVAVSYLGSQVGTCRLDLVVGDLIVELKCVASLNTAHRTQLKRYLALLELRRGLLVNFSPMGLEIAFVEGV
jgi:GxxExxY protein